MIRNFLLVFFLALGPALAWAQAPVASPVPAGPAQPAPSLSVAEAQQALSLLKDYRKRAELIATL